MKLSYRLVSLILLLFLPLYFFAMYYNYKDKPYKISSDEAKRLLRNKEFDVILDVRTDSERNVYGFYPGSVNIENSDLEKRMPTTYPNKNLHILVYCKSGRRARIAIDKLLQLGYKNVKYITGQHTSLR